MRALSALLEALGGEEGCKRLSEAFYARVGKDPVLHPFFPGKSLKCTIVHSSQRVPLGDGSCLSQNRTSICCLRPGLAFSED
jgi:hypothetical protein